MSFYAKTYTTFGTDIEYILSDEQGVYRAAIPFIRGSKSAPQIVRGGNVQKDNVAFEVAIDYSYHGNTILSHMGYVLRDAYTMIPLGWELNAIPSAMFPDEELVDPIAKEFGCDPDFDAKSGKTNVMDTSEVHPNFRSFGLHIHTGSCRLTEDTTQEMARLHVIASDFVLGLFSTIVDNSDAALDRRKLYGKPSAYRIKPYGVEYRTLSNFWSQSPDLMQLLYDLNDFTTSISTVGEVKTRILKKYDIYNIAQIIKDGDKVTAHKIWFAEVYPYLRDRDKRLVRMALQKDQYASIKTEWENFMPARETQPRGRRIHKCFK